MTELPEVICGDCGRQIKKDEPRFVHGGINGWRKILCLDCEPHEGFLDSFSEWDCDPVVEEVE